MTETDRPSTPMIYLEIIESHSEIVAKYIIDKLISFAVFEDNIKRIDKNINKHCYDVFTKKVIQELVGFEYMAFDKDEFSNKIPDYQEPKLFFDQVFFGSNNWANIDEPVNLLLIIETY